MYLKRKECDLMLTTAQASRMLGVSTSTLKNYDIKGILVPDLRLPTGARRYSIETIEKFRESLKLQSQKEETNV